MHAPLPKLTWLEHQAIAVMEVVPLTFLPGRGWMPGYPSPSGDGRLPFPPRTINKLVSSGIARWTRNGRTEVDLTAIGRELAAQRRAS